MTKLLVRTIRSRWPDARIILRGDSGFASERLMRWCDKNFVVTNLPSDEGILSHEVAAARCRG